MDTSAEQAVPAKCGNCNKPMSTPLVCDYCKELQPIPAATDYFSLLGLEHTFDIDREQLRRKFLALNRHAHPDYHTDDDPEVQQLSLRVSAAVNDAYRTLKDPASRAAYLLETLGGRSSARDKSVPQGFLETMMMLQEEIEQAGASGDEAELERLRRVVRTQRDGLLRRIRGLFADLEEAVGCEAVRQELLDEIRKQVNAVSYVRKLLALAGGEES